jgi:hypothetical protein
VAGKGSNRKKARGTHSGRLAGGTTKTGKRGSRGGRPPELLLISMNKGMAHKAKRR